METKAVSLEEARYKYPQIPEKQMRELFRDGRPRGSDRMLEVKETIVLSHKSER